MTQRILISGASGLIGSALARRLRERGDEVHSLGRSAEADVHWDIGAGTLDPDDVAGYDAVVHLAGESIASGRWNAAKKHEIRSSRVDSTRLLAQRLLLSGAPPAVFVQASATGYYGDRGDETLTEDSAPAGPKDFLSEVCVAWEAASALLRNRPKIRTVAMRTGMVLSANGGALTKMLTPFRFGVGGRLGSGQQFMSWISATDLARAYELAIDDERARGALNAVAPVPVRNREFTSTLGRVLGRPTILPTPAFALRLMFGEMADALLLPSARVVPQRLQDLGFEFEHPSLEEALRDVLDRQQAG